MATNEHLARDNVLYRLLGEIDPGEFGQHPACRDTDPELFFPLPGQTEQIDQAKAVCADCPVRVSCLAFALRNGEDHGIWGGTTEDERRAIRRRIHERYPSATAWDVARGVAIYDDIHAMFADLDADSRDTDRTVA